MRLPPRHVVTERFQDLVLELILHQRIEVISRKLPRSSVMACRSRIQRVRRRITHVARLRANDQASGVWPISSGGRVKRR